MGKLGKYPWGKLACTGSPRRERELGRGKLAWVEKTGLGTEKASLGTRTEKTCLNWDAAA